MSQGILQQAGLYLPMQKSNLANIYFCLRVCQILASATSFMLILGFKSLAIIYSHHSTINYTLPSMQSYKPSSYFSVQRLIFEKYYLISKGYSTEFNYEKDLLRGSIYPTGIRQMNFCQTFTVILGVSNFITWQRYG